MSRLSNLDTVQQVWLIILFAVLVVYGALEVVKKKNRYEPAFSMLVGWFILWGFLVQPSLFENWYYFAYYLFTIPIILHPFVKGTNN
jgi:hypothetical protein